jgi:hypothetical protein
MLRYHITTAKYLASGAMGAITGIIWLLFRRARLIDQDIPTFSELAFIK